MNLKWCYAILSVIICANAFEDVLSENGNPDKELNVSLQFTGFEYEDACFKSAESEWTFIKNPTNQTLESWVKNYLNYLNDDLILKIYLFFIPGRFIDCIWINKA